MQNDGSAEFNNVTVRGAITLQAGSDADWSYVSGSGKPDDNATAGAIWGVNITSQPTDAALLNAQQIWTDISGTGKPADNATVGATWGTDLLGKPEGANKLTSDASPAPGLNLTNTYLGYYNGSVFTTYMDGSGNFYLGGTGGKLQWNGSTLYINGTVRANAGYIGNGVSGFTINSTYFGNGKTAIDDGSAGVYVGTNGIALGASEVFTVTSAGALTATSATITGEITATSGYIGNGASGFAINNTYIGNGKAAIDDGNPGVYVGTDGIALGASEAFTVTSAGVLTATSATLTGSLTANAGAVVIDASGLVMTSGSNVLTINSASIMTLVNNALSHQLTFSAGSISVKTSGNTSTWSAMGISGATATDFAVSALTTGNLNLRVGSGSVSVGGSGDKIDFYGGTGTAKQTVTGSRGGNAALADLLTKLANVGLITDSTTA